MFTRPGKHCLTADRLVSQAAGVPEFLEECEDFRRPQLAVRPAATWDVEMWEAGENGGFSLW